MYDVSDLKKAIQDSFEYNSVRSWLELVRWYGPYFSNLYITELALVVGSSNVIELLQATYAQHRQVMLNNGFIEE